MPLNPIDYTHTIIYKFCCDNNKKNENVVGTIVYGKP